MYDAPVKNVIKLDDSADKPDGKVLVVSNEIPIGIVPAAGEGVGHII
jgi:adenosyl cobinamide kinase/adenosyl cobinamide phosphate guanylyltransferase